ncbi:MAG: MBL fold metallo-hydrolase [Deltaproteobacteria bacterium]|jgi:ribonuclease Z|nr:MBL fold metallo-hydrolase [Deltaproteobacteria bacterium]MBT4638164.1 MBL fold metallo-hydrolase [Deltaproteobacteria bacterium]MBT6499456.1 MBL fold metallo-hydrolase [Deltaproteobacteria bacterium]MBT6613244.1 MBL fold metallo-hydrolase [Deltaproteobacteria bacterium]MBT7892943.1 MBL fold metallo-hydrolase [Deltaproteobacteria bacterium]
MMIKIFKALLCAIVGTSLASCDSLMESQIKDRLTESQANQAAMLSSENMQVILLGTGGPLSNETRDSSGVAIIAGGEFVMVDVGPGIVKNMNLSGLPAGKISALFLTHFHSDHITEMGELDFMTWAQGRDKKLQVYGPEGVEQVVAGFNTAYAFDSSYRTAHHTEEWMPSKNSGMVASTLTIPDPEEAVLFFDRNGLKASVFQVDHSPVKPAVGYRFEYRGNVVVISGDTVKTETLPKFARGADLFLCEALNKEMVMMISRVAGELDNPRLSRQMHDVTDYHMSPVDAAEIAQEAGVKKLILAHVVPPVENFIAKRIYLRGTDDAFDGEIILGQDRARFELEPKN